MVRPILYFIAITLFAGCHRDWTNVIIEKRLYADGYYFHVPEKKFTPVKAYIPPVPYPAAHGNAVINRPVQPVYSVTTTESTPVFYPRPYLPPLPGPVYTYTFIPVNDTAVSSRIAGENGSGIKSNDSFPPKEHWETGTIVKTDSAMGKVASPPDTSYSIAEHDTLLTDTAEAFTVYAKYRNRKNLEGGTNGFLQLGIISGIREAGLPVKLGSYSAAMGMQCKIKVTHWNSVVFDFGYRFHQFYIGQNDPKAFPLSIAVHDHERISVNNFSMGISGRTIYHLDEKRLSWFDFGVYSDASFRTSNVYVDVINDAASPVSDKSKVTTKNAHLNYLNKLNYGVSFRVGWNCYSAFAMWRLSDFVKNSSSENKSDLPALVVGLEVSFGNQD
ncbi:hypothetical protein BH11BAC7_BH11BAC7_04940 [soil metagenome]